MKDHQEFNFQIRQLRPLILIAVFSNLLTIGLYNYAANQSGETGASLAFFLIWMPTIWIITILLSIILTIRQRKELFAGGIKNWTVATLLFCTPIPLYFGHRLTHPIPGTMRAGSSYSPKNGKISKSENWYYTADYTKTYIDKYFVTDSIEEKSKGENAYKRTARGYNREIKRVEKEINNRPIQG